MNKTSKEEKTTRVYWTHNPGRRWNKSEEREGRVSVSVPGPDAQAGPKDGEEKQPEQRETKQPPSFTISKVTDLRNTFCFSGEPEPERPPRSRFTNTLNSTWFYADSAKQDQVELKVPHQDDLIAIVINTTSAIKTIMFDRNVNS